jgi:hypothetical protein
LRIVNLERQAADLTSIVLAGCCASGFFGSITVSTPLANFASILLASTPSGSWK